ncbi:hypothetical protein L1987_71226 [Smallanthus sonchifolius]|uniref:Uncharacterized protein n=1 Tax=Smallanthus sonchifolius TaxID=185202 RepID=A0ACB9AR09_9ASTR|nr:hypothetical protein L1987_71226 [Smallanthus sonchifolius]
METPKDYQMESTSTPLVSTTCPTPSVTIPISTTHIDSINATLEKVLKQLVAQGESSCRQEIVIMSESENDDPEGAQGGDDHLNAS